jgi:uncharacterized protein (DUF885 family)
VSGVHPKRRTKHFTLIALALAGAGEAAPGKSLSADAQFRALYTSEYGWRQRQERPGEDNVGGPRMRLPDVGPAAQALKLERWAKTAASLAKLAPSLSNTESLNLAVYRGQIDALLNEQKFRDYERPLNADSSFWGDVAASTQEPFYTEQDYRRYITMLRDIPRYYGQQIANMRAGVRRGFTVPRVALQGRDADVAAIAAAKTPAGSPFYAPLRIFPSQIPAATQAALRAEAEAAIRGAVIPAHRKLLAFLRAEYIPGATARIDAYSLPDGRAYYQSKISEYTTLDQTPEQVHAIGLAEVAKICIRMHGVMRQVGFTGDLHAFLNFLRTDKQFYAMTPQELLNRAAWIAKTVDGKLSRYFRRLPRMRFAIKPVPAEIAPFYTGGRGGPGIYLVNTYDLPARPLYSLPALTLHESAPGHAFQMPLTAENKTLPAFRRESYLSVYGEGWALYCEALGEEMGIYETPYEVFGMLSYQMWRAARLVVDTGIHAKGWTREQARAYLHDNTALSDHEIGTEVDRYIAWPGQAVSYYTGQLAIQSARAEAEKVLGPKFDIRDFHDAILEIGAVPLPELDARIDRLIADGGKGPYTDDE